MLFRSRSSPRADRADSATAPPRVLLNGVSRPAMFRPRQRPRCSLNHIKWPVRSHTLRNHPPTAQSVSAVQDHKVSAKPPQFHTAGEVWPISASASQPAGRAQRISRPITASTHRHCGAHAQSSVGVCSIPLSVRNVPRGRSCFTSGLRTRRRSIPGSARSADGRGQPGSDPAGRVLLRWQGMGVGVEAAAAWGDEPVQPGWDLLVVGRQDDMVGLTRGLERWARETTSSRARTSAAGLRGPGPRAPGAAHLDLAVRVGEGTIPAGGEQRTIQPAVDAA